MSDELPDGWAEAALMSGLISNIQTGFACGKHSRDGRGMAHLRPMNVSEAGRVVLDDVKFIDAAEADRDERLLRRGDVVFNNTNSPELVGKTGLYEFAEPRAFSNHMTRLRCTEGVLDPKFCALALHHRWQQGYFYEKCNNHVSQASVGREVLLATEVALPPLPEQHRIVTQVEALLEHVNRAKGRLDRVPLILKRFRQAVLAAACSGELTKEWRAVARLMPLERDSLHARRLSAFADLVSRSKREGRRTPRKPDGIDSLLTDRWPPDGVDCPAEWTWLTLAECAAVEEHAISSGPFGSALGTKDYVESGVPVVRGQNIQGGRFVLKNFVYVKLEKATLLQRSTARPGDIIVVAVGSSGESAVIPPELPWAVLSQNCNKFTLDQRIAMPAFVNFALQLASAREQLRDHTTDTARPFLSLTNAKSTFIPVPPLEEQTEIVRQVDHMFALAETIERRVEAATARADKLPQAVLSKAFSGELVPTEAELARAEGRRYETAEELLRRVTTRATSPPRRTRAKRKARSA